jgi:hypothetical protein
MRKNPAPPAADLPHPGAALRCRNCGARNHAYAAFCIGCGEPTLEEVSSIEADARPSRRLRLLQGALGLVILLSVGWLIAGWLDGEGRQNSYRQGAAALAAHDWAGAVRAFQAAGTFADAPARAQQAAQTLRVRTRLANAAEYAALARDWPEELRILDKLLQIDPQDAGARSQQAFVRDKLLTQSLPGTLYLVAAGPDAGLYVNLQGARNVKLPGGDGRSRPRAWNAAGDSLIYDRPASRTASPGGVSGFRQSVLVRFPHSTVDATRPDLLATEVLPPAIIPSGDGMFAPDGLYWKIYPRDDSLSDRLLSFYRFADGGIEPITVSRQWGYVMATNEATGLALLVAPPTDQDPTSHITVSRPGAAPVIDEVIPGWLTAAAFSPDGRYLLFSVQNGSFTTALTRSLYLARLTAGGASSPSYRRVDLLRSTITAHVQPPETTADFVPRPVGATDDILIAVRDEARMTLILRNLTGGMETTVWSGPAPEQIDAWAISDNGAWLAYVVTDKDDARLVLQRLAADTAPRVLNSAVFRAGAVLRFVAGGEKLVYRTLGLVEDAPGALYSLDVGTIDLSPGGTPPLHPIYLGTAGGGALPTSAATLDGTLLLYIDAHEILHAVDYAATIDLTLPGHIAGVWSLRGVR